MYVWNEFVSKDEYVLYIQQESDNKEFQAHKPP